MRRVNLRLLRKAMSIANLVTVCLAVQLFMAVALAVGETTGRLRLPYSKLLGALVTETAHGVTGVASLILLADIGDLRALQLYLQSWDQRNFGVNDDVSRNRANFDRITTSLSASPVTGS
jgi:hypothetical protein